MKKIKFYFKNIFFIFLITQNIYALSVNQSQQLSDSNITAYINHEIANDKLISFFQINVTTQNGNVMLSGTVDSIEDAFRVIDIANNVVDINNIDVAHLKIKTSNQPISDLLITAKVKIKFFQHNLLVCKSPCFKHIKVETFEKIIYLTGYAKNKLEVNQAIMLANEIKDKVEVKANISVKKLIS